MLLSLARAKMTLSKYRLIIFHLTQSVIAVSLTLAIIYSSIVYRDVPAALSSSLSLILGFYLSYAQNGAKSHEN
jgi:hypothetical protein